jgi:tRNA A37 N6-isopentenylltransferase MiaA
MRPLEVPSAQQYFSRYSPQVTRSGAALPTTTPPSSRTTSGVDAAAAASILPTDGRRIVRALEVLTTVSP